MRAISNFVSDSVVPLRIAFEFYLETSKTDTDLIHSVNVTGYPYFGQYLSCHRLRGGSSSRQAMPRQAILRREWLRISKKSLR